MSKNIPASIKACGTCSVCCVSLRIDYEGLRKMPDVPCTHIRIGGGCSIYNQRPQGCRNWSCGWIKMPDLLEKWRPDKCGFLIRLEGNRLIFQATTNIGHSRFWTTDFISEVFALLSKGYDLGISIPTKKGFTYNLTHLTPRLLKAAQSGNIEEAKIAMRAVVFQAKNAQTDPETPL